MRRFHSIILMLCLSLVCRLVQAQPEGAKTEAWQLAQEGHTLISQGDFEKAVQKFSFAHKLVPDNADFQLGLAEAWFFTKDYDRAMDLCRPLMAGRKARVQAFQIYGNCQDGKGQTYEALETYRKGLNRFPNGGVLYMEMGLVEAARGELDVALSYWEQGMAAQPTLPSNYYFAAERLFAMGDYAWAANYAELFINLERTGERVRDMSRLLMACYEKARVYDYQKAFQWRFFQGTTLNAGIPSAYPPLAKALDDAFASEFTDTTATISIANLLILRRFVCHLLPSQLPQDQSIGLWEWQQLLAQNGHLEAYTYWMLFDARQDEFLDWFKTHQGEYEAFEGWFLRNTFHRHIKKPVLRTIVSPKQ